MIQNYGFSPERLARRNHLIDHGIDPYPSVAKRSHSIDQVLSSNSQQIMKEVDLVGRLLSIEKGPELKLIFEDASGRINAYIDSNTIANHQFILDNIDKGDFIGVKGVLKQNESNEPYIKLISLTILTKALKDLPNPIDWDQNKNAQRSQRYVDLAVRKKAQEIFRTRVQLIRNIRNFLEEQGMWEIETPILRSWYDLVCFDQFSTKDVGGRPLYLRLCHEDQLKKLISGGFEKVFELGKSFRPDNVSWKHSPEFLQLETIQAYTDYQDMMKHAENLYSIVTKKTIGKTEIRGRRGDKISLLPPWKKITVRDAILEFAGIDIYSASNPDILRKEIEKLSETPTKSGSSSPYAMPPADSPLGTENLPPEPYCNWFWGLVEHCIGTFVEPNLIQPTILYDYPVDSNWLVKRKRERPDYIERFEAYIDGIEIANCYTLVNDPVDFIERLEDEKSWYCAAFGRQNCPLDLSLIQAKAYGLPPMSESSFGIDRWLMIICEQESIQDVIWIPYPHV